MAAKKTVSQRKTDLSLLSVDYGREDINNIARKVNEIIESLNK